MVLTLYEAYGIYSLLHDSAATYQHHYSLIGFLNRYFVVPFYLLVYLLFCLEEYDTEYPLFTITDSESSFNLDEKNKWSDQTIAKADEKGRTSRLLYSCSLELLFFFSVAGTDLLIYYVFGWSQGVAFLRFMLNM